MGEIKDCIWEMHLLKALGPYSFLSVFYREYWEVVNEQVIRT